MFSPNVRQSDAVAALRLIAPAGITFANVEGNTPELHAHLIQCRNYTTALCASRNLGATLVTDDDMVSADVNAYIAKNVSALATVLPGAGNREILTSIQAIRDNQAQMQVQMQTMQTMQAQMQVQMQTMQAQMLANQAQMQASINHVTSGRHLGS